MEDRFEAGARHSARECLKAAYENVNWVLRKVEARSLTLAPDDGKDLEEARARIQRVAMHLG